MRPRLLIAAVPTALTTVLSALVLLVAPAAAEEGVPPTPTPVRMVAGDVSADRAPVGETVTSSGGGFAPGAELRLSVDGAETGTTIAAADGTFAVPVTLTTPGEWMLGVIGPEPDGRMRVVTANVTVVAADAAASRGSSETPDLATPLLLGLGLVAVCAAGVLLAQRRRTPVRVVDRTA